MSLDLVMPVPVDAATEHETLVRQLTELRDGTHPWAETSPPATTFEWPEPLLALVADR